MGCLGQPYHWSANGNSVVGFAMGAWNDDPTEIYTLINQLDLYIEQEKICRTCRYHPTDSWKLLHRFCTHDDTQYFFVQWCQLIPICKNKEKRCKLECKRTIPLENSKRLQCNFTEFSNGMVCLHSNFIYVAVFVSCQIQEWYQGKFKAISLNFPMEWFVCIPTLFICGSSIGKFKAIAFES